jgi:hypothetical protein
METPHIYTETGSVIKENYFKYTGECDFLRNKRVPNGPP